MANSYYSDVRGGWGIELIMTILPRNLSDAAVGEVIDLSVRPRRAEQDRDADATLHPSRVTHL